MLILIKNTIHEKKGFIVKKERKNNFDLMDIEILVKLKKLGIPDREEVVGIINRMIPTNDKKNQIVMKRQHQH